MSRRKQARMEEAHALNVALELSTEGHSVEDMDPRVQVAALLEPATTIRESSREQTKARMLRAFDAAGAPSPGRRDDAGTRDETVDVAVHTAFVDLPDGGSVSLADVERIGAEKAARIAAKIQAFSRGPLS